MNLALWKKNWLDARLVLLACVVVVFAYCWVRVWLVSQLEMSRFAQIVDQVWDKWERFATVPLSFLLTYTGRVSIAFVEPIVTVSMAVWAVTRGSDAVSGELGRGTMEMLLAQPVSRLQVLWTQAATTIAGIALLALAVWGGTAVGVSMNHVEEEVAEQRIVIPFLNWKFDNPLAPVKTVKTPMRDVVDLAHFGPATFSFFCYGVCLAGIVTLFSACDNYRWRTIGLGIGVLIGSIILKAVGTAVEEWRFLRLGSLLTAYEPERFTMIAMRQPEHAWSLLMSTPAGAMELGPLGYSLVLLSIGLLAYAGAAAVFTQRDIPAPL